MVGISRSCEYCLESLLCNQYSMALSPPPLETDMAGSAAAAARPHHVLLKDAPAPVGSVLLKDAPAPVGSVLLKDAPAPVGSASLAGKKRGRPRVKWPEGAYYRPKKRVAAAASRLAAAVSAVELKKDGAVQVVRNPKPKKPRGNAATKKEKMPKLARQKKKRQTKPTTKKKRNTKKKIASEVQAKTGRGAGGGGGGGGGGTAGGGAASYSPRNQVEAKSTVAKPVTPFEFFCMETRPLIEAHMPDALPAHVSRLLGVAFRSLPETDRLPFYAKAEGDRLRHMRECAHVGEEVSAFFVSYAF